MDLKQFKTTKEKVKAILDRFPKTKDCDTVLVFMYKRLFFMKPLRDISAQEIYEATINKSLPNDDTITRARRQINQNNESTRGMSYMGRKEQEKVVREGINS